MHCQNSPLDKSHHYMNNPLFLTTKTQRRINGALWDKASFMSGIWTSQLLISTPRFYRKVAVFIYSSSPHSESWACLTAIVPWTWQHAHTQTHTHIRPLLEKTNAECVKAHGCVRGALGVFGCVWISICFQQVQFQVSQCENDYLSLKYADTWMSVNMTKQIQNQNQSHRIRGTAHYLSNL